MASQIQQALTLPRAPKSCGRTGCPERVVARTYCAAHEAERQTLMAQRRGTTTARGYGTRHRNLRTQWAPRVATGTVPCWRCGDLIAPGTAWDLGHTDDRSGYGGPEHARACNRSAGGRTTPQGYHHPRRPAA